MANARDLTFSTWAVLWAGACMIILGGALLLLTWSLGTRWVDAVEEIARNTAVPTASAGVEHAGKPYVIVVPQRDGVSNGEWIQSLEDKLLAVAHQ